MRIFLANITRFPGKMYFQRSFFLRCAPPRLALRRVLPEVKGKGALASLRTTVQTESVLERSYDIYGSVHGEERSHG